ncbi:MAG: sigma-70 family RNA polymerase sigma factor [Dysgonamonadaceae bacterium]|jgi:RNA polymerase sigma factor (sigma-70 family)|nr:sigma-70 family RNA polymerase sigma factor [Dysgonamonadaceae bacterium]
MKKSKSLKHSSEIPAIYQEYRDELKGYISKRIDFKEDVEDIMQNVFYNLARIDLIENPIEHISSWLYSVAQNQIIDFYRKKKEERFPAFSDKKEDEWVKNMLEILSDPNENPEIKYMQSLVWEELETALAHLPAEQRAVFELTELEGFSFKEIAESTGISLNTLLSRKRYAILFLRERLQEMYRDLLNE